MQKDPRPITYGKFFKYLSAGTDSAPGEGLGVASTYKSVYFIINNNGNTWIQPISKRGKQTETKGRKREVEERNDEVREKD